MAGLNVGELYAKLGLDTKEFKAGTKAAKKETKELGKTVRSDMTGALKNAERSSKNLKKALTETANSQKNLKQQTEKASEAAEEEGDVFKELKEKIKDFGEKAGGLSGVFTALKGVLGVLGITALISGWVDKVKEFAKECEEAASKYQEMLAVTTISTGSATDTARYAEWGKAAMVASPTLGFTQEDYTTAFAAIGSVNPSIKENQELMTKLSTTYLLFAEAMGTDVGSALSETDTLFKKWGIDAEDQAGYLEYFYEATRHGVDLSTLVSTLTEGKVTFDALGLSIEEVALLMQDAYSQGTLTEFTSSITGMNSVLKQSSDYFADDASLQTFLNTLLACIGAGDDFQTVFGKLEEQYPEVAAKIPDFSRWGGTTEERLTAAQALIDSGDYSLGDKEWTAEARDAVVKSAEDSRKAILGSAAKAYEDWKAEVVIARVDAEDKLEDYLYNNGNFFENWWKMFTGGISSQENSVTVVVEDKTSDGVTARMKSQQSSINQANNPVM